MVAESGTFVKTNFDQSLPGFQREPRILGLSNLYHSATQSLVQKPAIIFFKTIKEGIDKGLKKLYKV